MKSFFRFNCKLWFKKLYESLESLNQSVAYIFLFSVVGVKSILSFIFYDKEKAWLFLELMGLLFLCLESQLR